MNSSKRHELLELGIGLALAAAALFARWLLDPYLATRYYLVSLYAGVLLAVWLGGYRAGIVAAVAGYVGADLFLIEPLWQFNLTTWPHVSRLIAYLIINGLIISFGAYMHSSRRQLATEVEERRRAELQLERSQLLFERIAGASPDMVYLYDLQQRCNIYCNREVGRILGYSPEEVTKRGETLFRELMHPEDRKRLHAGGDPVAKLLDGQVLQTEYRLLHADGSYRWLRSRDVVFERDEEGRPRVILGLAQDITADRAAAQTLADSEERFRLAAEAVNGIIYEADLVADTVVRTRGLYEVTGYQTDEVPATAAWWFEQIHPEDINRVRNSLAQPLASGEGFISEYRVRHRDGRWLHVIDRSLISRRDENGNITRMVGCTQDITDSRRAEAALRASEERLAAVLASIDDHLICHDREWRYTYVNPAAAGTLCRRPEELLGRCIWELFPEAVGNLYHEELHRAVAEDRVIRFEHYHEPFGRWYENHVYPSANGVTVFASDVTARKQAEQALRESEERFRSLAALVPSVIWTAGPDGTITFANERWYRYCGLDAERNASQWHELVLHPADRDRCLDAWNKALREGSEYEIEIRNRRHDGVYRWFVVRATPCKDPLGRIESWFGVATDIHDLKELQDAREEADRRKDEFLATLAHELRNPLAPIRHSLEILRLADRPALRDGAMAVMERQISHLVRLVDDLLDISRITRGKIELRKAGMDLVTAVRAAVETSRPLIDEQEHTLTVTLPDAPLPVEGDLTRLAQVFANLLNNAAKYTPRGGNLALTAECHQGEAVVTVVDDGMGLTAAQLPRLFQMFAQGDESLSRSKGGLGIGLALVRGLVEMHGGRVDVFSDGRGKGSRFTVRLPLATMILQPVPRPVTPLASRPCRVLIADDNEDGADSLAVLLQLYGHDVRTVYDGEAAIEAEAEFSPDVTLLDIGMPRMDGYEAAGHIRARRGQGVRLIAMTGWGQERDKRRSAEAGFDYHLTKPIDLDELQRLLDVPQRV